MDVAPEYLRAMSPRGGSGDRDKSLIKVLGQKIDPKVFFLILGAAALWYLSDYFVTQKEYNKDMQKIDGSLSEMRSDIKQILINQGKK